MRAYWSFGAVDVNAPLNIANARVAGFEDIDVYFFPCSYGKPIDTQVEEFYASVKNPKYVKALLESDSNEAWGLQAGGYEDTNSKEENISNFVHVPETGLRQKVLDASTELKFGIVWVDVETNPSPNCGWTTDFVKNCEFLSELVDKLKVKGFPVGIYLSNYMWN